VSSPVFGVEDMETQVMGEGGTSEGPLVTPPWGPGEEEVVPGGPVKEDPPPRPLVPPSLPPTWEPGADDDQDDFL